MFTVARRFERVRGAPRALFRSDPLVRSDVLEGLTESNLLGILRPSRERPRHSPDRAASSRTYAAPSNPPNAKTAKSHSPAHQSEPLGATWVKSASISC